VILAVSVTQAAGDVEQLFAMTDRMRENLSAVGIDDDLDVVLANAAYCLEQNLKRAEASGLDMLIATGRLKHHERVTEAPRGPIPKGTGNREPMARPLRTTAGRTDYARQTAIVEVVFGRMTLRQRAGQLRLRGLAGATGERRLHAIRHNLRKLGNQRVATAAMT